MKNKRDALKKFFSFCLIIGLLIGGGITIFAEESEGAMLSSSTDANLFFFIYNAVKDKSGDIFSLLAAAVSLTLFLVVKEYLIPLLNRVLKSVVPDDGKDKKAPVPFDEDENEKEE